MELLVSLAAITVALWLVHQIKMPFAAGLPAVAFVALVAYVLLYSLAAYTVAFLRAVTHAVTSVPAFIPLMLLIGLAGGYFLARKGNLGGGGPFKPW